MTPGEIEERYESLKGYFGENKVSLKEFERFIKFKVFFENKPVSEGERGKKGHILLAFISILQEEKGMDYISYLNEGFLKEMPVDETLIERIPVETLAEPISMENFAETFAAKIPLSNFLLIIGIIAGFIAAGIVIYLKFGPKRPVPVPVLQEDAIKPFLLIAVEKEKLEKFQSPVNGAIAITDENKGDFLKIPRYLLTKQSKNDKEQLKDKMGQGDFIVLSIEPKDMSAFGVGADPYTQKAGFNSLAGSSLTILGQADRDLLREKNFRQAKV